MSGGTLAPSAQGPCHGCEWTLALCLGSGVVPGAPAGRSQNCSGAAPSRGAGLNPHSDPCFPPRFFF